ncbi:PE-PPE domain-containing protein [Mycobacterium sp. ACS4331]|uniref:PE-PPE domain-containing protein n=1 Tax=Mycobacterium sp. ACS4331 TaxID=1834121 RepID=UPI0012F76112|nr:PE-PPE domain-containing protein [Mycobacterium sp. ACS4331]
MALASAMAVSVAPFTAEAATYIVGAPDWLGVNNIENDADTIYESIVQDREKPVVTLVGWGTGGVDLKPVWVQWYNPNLGGLELGDIDVGSLSAAELATLLTQLDLGELTDTDNDQYYTPRTWGQVGTEQVLVDNPEYQAAFEAALAEVMQEDRDKILASDKIDVTFSYAVAQPDWWTKGYFGVSLASVIGPWSSQKIFGKPVAEGVTTTVTIDNPFKNDPVKLDAFLKTGVYTGQYPVVINDPLGALGIARPNGVSTTVWNALTGFVKPINIGNVPYSFDRTKFGIPGESWEDRAEAAVDPSIPKQIYETQPVEGWLPGGWTTNTFGQWVSPTDDITGLEDLDLAALLSGDIDLSDLSALTGMSTRDLAYYLSGDLGFLAPLLNWTTYVYNTNLIGYGDGAITAGLAYQKFIDAVTSGEVKAGAPQTDGRYIKITTDANGNPVVQEVNHTVGNGGLDEIITSYPLPGDLNFPDMPTNPDGSPRYPAYTEIPGGVLDLHLFTLTLLRNPGRANGGLYARFAPIYQELTGVNPVSPDSQNVLPEGLEGLDIAKLLLGEGGAPNIQLDDLGNLVAIMESADGKPMVITIKTDLTWEYDLLSDAPVTASPVAWANSAVAALLAVNLASALVNYEDSGLDFNSYTGPDGTIYGTVTLDQLPLLSPIRLVAGALGAATGTDINTPLADALEPLLKTLTNVSYTDWERVVEADGTITYDRTLDQMHVPTLFGTETMTRAQKAQLAGDVISILGAGIGAEITDINGRFLGQVEKLLGALNVTLPAELKEAWQKTVPVVGDAITKVSSEVGKGVSKFLTGVVGAVEPKLPKELQQPSFGEQQTQLAAGQREVGKAVKAAKDRADELSERATDLTNDLRDRLEKPGAQDELIPTDGTDSTQSVSRTPVKDAVKKAEAGLKKAGADVKKAVDKAVDKVKKAVTPKKKTTETSE